MSVSLDCRCSSQRSLRRTNNFAGRFGHGVRHILIQISSLPCAPACSRANKFFLLSISFFEISKREFTSLWNPMRTEWGNFVECLALDLLVSVTDNWLTVLPTFPFLLFSCYGFWNLFLVMLWGWLCFPSDTEVGDWTRSEHPTPRPFRAMHTAEADSATYWLGPCELVKNSLLGIQRGWYVTWGCWPGGHGTPLFRSWWGHTVWLCLSRTHGE